VTATVRIAHVHGSIVFLAAWNTVRLMAAIQATKQKRLTKKRPCEKVGCFVGENLIARSAGKPLRTPPMNRDIGKYRGERLDGKDAKE